MGIIEKLDAALLKIREQVRETDNLQVLGILALMSESILCIKESIIKEYDTARKN